MGTKTFVIANNVGLSGKTTTVANLAVCLSILGKKVLIVDYSRDAYLDLVIVKNHIKHQLIREATPLIHYSKLTLEDSLASSQSNYDFILADTHSNNWEEVYALYHDSSLIVPVVCEFYGLNSLESLLRRVSKGNVTLEGVLPVMHREESEVSNTIVKHLHQKFENLMFDTQINRNFYLAFQTDLEHFTLQNYNENAALTYLNLATILVDRYK